MRLKLLNLYLLSQENGFKDFLDGLKKDFFEVIEDFKKFFISLKEMTYDVLVTKFGETPINMLLLALLFIIIMLIIIKFINR